MAVTFSVAVPTYKRPDTLRTTLESILVNRRKPDEVLVIDDDVLSEQFLLEMSQQFTEKRIPFIYKKKDHTKLRRGLSESKNWAVEIAKSDVICFLDDDVVLEPDYCAALMHVWETHWSDEKLIGIGGRAINNRPTTKLEHIFRTFFGLTGTCSWDVNEVGFQAWDESVDEVQRAYYLHGCASSYRRQLLLKMPFATFAGGRTALEDVEHCLRAKHEGLHFLYAPTARLVHHQAAVGRDHAMLAGQKESRNRREIFLRHCKQDLWHKVWFLWANVGWLLKKLFAFKFREAGGMIAGLFS